MKLIPCSVFENLEHFSFFVFYKKKRVLCFGFIQFRFLRENSTSLDSAVLSLAFFQLEPGLIWRPIAELAKNDVTRRNQWLDHLIRGQHWITPF